MLNYNLATDHIYSHLPCNLSLSPVYSFSTNEHDLLFVGRRHHALHPVSHLAIIHCAFSHSSPLNCLNEWLTHESSTSSPTPVRLFMKLFKIRNGLVTFDTVDSIFSRIAIILVFHISHNCTTYPVSPARNTGDTVNLPPFLHLIRHQMLSIPPQK